MSWIHGVRARLRSLLFRRAADERMVEEFRFHIEMQVEENLRRGLEPDEARRRALVAFGSTEGHGVAMRNDRRLPGVELLWHDLRLSARALARAPGFTLAAVLTLALGIGLTTGMFSVIEAVLFRGPPHAQGSRLVYVSHASPSGGSWQDVDLHDFDAYTAAGRSFSHLMAVRTASVTLAGGAGLPERVAAARVSATLFDGLGETPQLGRVFNADEARGRGDPVVLLGNEIWHGRFAADPGILGRRIRVDGRDRTVVGVMRPGFAFPTREQLWLPLELDVLGTPAGEESVAMLGRVRAGVALESAHSELAAIAGRSEQASPGSHRGVRPVLRPYVDYVIGPGPRGLLLTMFGAVACVLLIACTNVANLLVARAVVRRRELSLRSALGAGRVRIIGQALGEAWLLCAAGAVLGLAIAWLLVVQVDGALATRVPPWMHIGLDSSALAFTASLTLVTAVLAGLLPALQTLRADARTVLGEEGRGASSFRIGRASRVLVGFEVALSCALLVAAGLTTRSIAGLRVIDLGFDDAHLLTASLMLPETTYPDSALPVAYARLEAELEVRADVEAVTVASAVPGLGAAASPVALAGRPVDRPGDLPHVQTLAVSPSFLRAIGTDVIAGRDFTSHDGPGADPVALVNHTFATRFFGNEAVLGARIRVDGPSGPGAWRTVVGIVPDIRLDELADGRADRAFVLVPLAQQVEARGIAILARTRGDPLSATASLRAAVAAVDRDLPLEDVRPLRAAIRADTWFIYLFGGLFSLFGIAALVMAAVGLYGVLAFLVSRRTREIGIRVALGATAAQVRLLVLGQGMRSVVIGLAVGMLLAAALARSLAVILFDVRAHDAAVYGAVCGTLLSVALCACLLPAGRAARIQPVRALSD